jgi:hypothetical protein
MELDKKLRILDQSLSMHSDLRDRYKRRSLIVDLSLLACSVVFCASAFAGDSALSHFGTKPDLIRYFLRVSSVLAFMLSILSLRIDWKGKSAAHHDATGRLSRALASFRDHRQSDGTWPSESIPRLDDTYWAAMHNSVPIPEADFVRLKARHLRKVELSKMVSSHPGCPVIALRLALLCSSLRQLLSGKQQIE